VRVSTKINNDQLVLVKHFYSEAEASIYAARLRDVGVDAVLQNDTAYVMLPVGEKGIRLFVPSSEVVIANDLILEMDINKTQPVEESFHDADLEDILYQKSLHDGTVSSKMMYVAIGMSIILVLYVCYLSSSGKGLYHDNAPSPIVIENMN